MRICLVVHGFPPLERTGVENHTAALARALVRAGHRVEVFAPRVVERLPQLSMRRELGEGFGITWLTTNRPPRDPAEALDPPGIAERFGEFLDRERPEVVHFQHVIKLGLGLVEEARARRIPTLLSAHDYYGICHRYTLIRPDLSRCDTIGDAAACARCDMALSILNRQPDLGDYHMGALPDQLDEAGRASLAGILGGDAEGAGFSAEEWERALERRTALDRRRAEVFAQFDRILPPSEFLAEQLKRGGLDAERIYVMRLGIETDRVEGVEPPRPDRSAPMRFGFVGSLTKHKGVHVLIEAFQKLTEPAECLVWGDSTDRTYVRRMQERAAEAGVQLLGHFEQDELAECLSRVDVLVVPSIWVENHPLTIREAFAAGRPVIASRCGALPENVRDGIDGLLFEPGDSDDLARVMTRLMREDDLFETLTADLPPPKKIATQVDELVPLYDELIAAERERAATQGGESLQELPAHLVAVADRHRELDGLPTRDLFGRALKGLGALRIGLDDVDLGPEEILSRALATESKTQILITDLLRKEEWMRTIIDDGEKTATALRERVSWRERELEEASKRAQWLEEEKKGADEERSWLTGLRGELEKERDWLRDEVANRDQELERLRGDLLQQAATLQAFEAEIATLTGTFDDERGALRDRLRTTAELALNALRAQETVMGQEIGEVVGIIDDYFRRRAADGDPGSAEEGPAPNMDEMVPAARRASDALKHLVEELEWRRQEMDTAVGATRRPLARLLFKRTGLGRRVASWAAEENKDDDGPTADDTVADDRDGEEKA